MATVKIYTDGSAHNNGPHRGRRGGYGIYMLVNNEARMFYGGQYIQTTSARMEAMGMLMALRKCEPGDSINIYCDNQYLVYAFAKYWIFRWEAENWKKRANADLLKLLLEEYRRLKGKILFHWVRGHVGITENEICDVLAAAGGSSEEIIVDLQTWEEA